MNKDFINFTPDNGSGESILRIFSKENTEGERST